MNLRFGLRYLAERGAWRVGTALREWACISAGGSHDYLSDNVEDGCIVCGHYRQEEPKPTGGVSA